jgi:aspartyl-tRNA(Asn)/glutamyl-tRNA(Gln) amidotransferase subunit A
VSDDLAFVTVVELGRLLRQRKVSATQLATYFLDRLERYGPRFNAVVTVTRERALAEAAQADREIRQGKWRGPLHGIPYGVKDLLATKGYPTTWGAEPYRGQHLDADATVVERLGAAGGVLVAKLAMVELAGGMGYNQANASFTGPGKTPWNPGYWSGGSSSGPGAAVAAGLVPFAIGSETSGSILTPAAYCGVTGLRPTYGLVSRHGAMALAWTMDKLGPMGRSADDCALVLAAIAGRDARDPSSVARGFRVPPPSPPPVGDACEAALPDRRPQGRRREHPARSGGELPGVAPGARGHH